MAIIRTAGLAAAIALGVGISIAPTMATELPVEGGPGGSTFDQRCHKGEYLVGFHVRRGTWLDRIQILCAPHLQPRYQVGGRTFRGAPAGGGGGGEFVVTCRSSDTAIGRIEFTHTWSSEAKTVAYVTGLSFTCFDLAPPHAAATPAVEVVKEGPGGEGFASRVVRDLFRQPCPAGQLAVGLRGRAGKYVDALGLVCGPAPKPPITALGKPKRPDPPIPVIGRPKRPDPSPGTGTTPPPPPVQPQGFAIDCRGGGKMKLSQDGNFLRISFKRAADGSARRAPKKGECAWTDRPVNDREPTLLVYAGGDKSKSLIRAVKRGDAFRARAVNNNQGALVILDVD